MKVLANDGIDELGKSLLEEAGFEVVTDKIEQSDLVNGTGNHWLTVQGRLVVDTGIAVERCREISVSL